MGVRRGVLLLLPPGMVRSGSDPLLLTILTLFTAFPESDLPVYLSLGVPVLAQTLPTPRFISAEFSQ